MKSLVLVITLVFFSSQLLAQDVEGGGEKKRKSGFAVSFVKLLPNQISGVTEIVTLGNFALFIPISRHDLTFGYSKGTGSGASWSNFYVSTNSNMKIADLDSFVYVGADVVNYSSSVANNRTEFGGHLGGGVEFYMNQTATFRAEMKFNVNPGTSLMVMFGFLFPW